MRKDQGCIDSLLLCLLTGWGGGEHVTRFVDWWARADRVKSFSVCCGPRRGSACEEGRQAGTICLIASLVMDSCLGWFCILIPDTASLLPTFISLYNKVFVI